MRPIPPFTRYQEKILEHYYASPLRAEAEWTCPRAEGFLFAVACEPELVMPHEWLPVLMSEGASGPTSEQELEGVAEALLSLHNWIESAIAKIEIAVPETCLPSPESPAGFDRGSPVSEWSNGFISGCDWLGASEWHDFVPESKDLALGALLITLSFFANRAMAETFFEEVGKPHGVESFESMVAVMAGEFGGAAAEYGMVALAVRTALASSSAAGEPEEPEPEPSRNAPCPCGSGKKYKTCCGKKAKGKEGEARS